MAHSEITTNGAAMAINTVHRAVLASSCRFTAMQPQTKIAAMMLPKATAAAMSKNVILALCHGLNLKTNGEFANA